MKDSSDAEALHSQVLFLKMREKTTEELVSIWVENNQKAWSKDELDAIQKVLIERLGNLPAQKTQPEKRVVSARKRSSDSEEKLGEPFFNLSPYNNFRAAIGIFCLVCLCLGAIVATMVEQNTAIFWNFAENATTSNIEKIEIQRLDQNSTGFGNIITISDEERINEFIAALQTIEDYQVNHPSPIHEVRIKIWRTKRNLFNLQHTIEFECYTMKDEGNVLFVGSVWVKPGVYSYGNGNAKFVAPNLINWLRKNGISIQ